MGRLNNSQRASSCAEPEEDSKGDEAAVVPQVIIQYPADPIDY